MKWFIVIIPVMISYYTFTYGLWAWKNGNRSGGAGVFFLVAFTLAFSIFAIFIRTGF